MAGPIQKAMSDIVTTGSAIATLGKRLTDDERQAREKERAEIKTQEENYRAVQKEAQDSALEADLINMGAEPNSAHAFVVAKELGLNTKGFGIIRKKGKFVGSYSSLAEKLSRDALTDSLSSKVLNKRGFAERVNALSNNRKGRVEALVEASKGGK